MKTIKERERALVRRLARRAEKGLKVPQEFKDFAARLGLFLIDTQKAINEANKIIEVQNTHGMESYFDYIRNNPPSPSAITLIGILKEEAALREKQRKIAQKNRPNALNALIMEIVKDRPEITDTELLAVLKSLRGGGCIDSIDDETIEWTDSNGCVKDSKVRWLKDRLSYAKKKIKNKYSR